MFQFGQGGVVQVFFGDGFKGDADVFCGDASGPLRIVRLKDLTGADEPIAEFDVAEANRLRPVLQRQILHAHVFGAQQLNRAVNRRRDVGEHRQPVTLHDVREVQLRLGQIIVFALAHTLALNGSGGWEGGGGGEMVAEEVVKWRR